MMNERNKLQNIAHEKYKAIYINVKATYNNFICICGYMHIQ